jgi:hypothetical protein
VWFNLFISVWTRNVIIHSDRPMVWFNLLNSVWTRHVIIHSDIPTVWFNLLNSVWTRHVIIHSDRPTVWFNLLISVWTRNVIIHSENSSFIGLLFRTKYFQARLCHTAQMWVAGIPFFNAPEQQSVVPNPSCRWRCSSSGSCRLQCSLFYFISWSWV